ncbi:tRNA pseudouridine synthase A [Bacteroidia bacterium]|nr:tRNA pseudouridine synthase A [Bacteroidia bacterium]
MKRYFIYLAYNGKDFCGWQIQPNGTTVQETLEHTLGVLLQQPIAITGAGRTDAGVHARLMVAHADLPIEPEETANLTDRLNGMLPKTIVIDKIVPVRPDAHARFDAVSRTYQYYITGRKNPFQYELSYKVKKLPDLETMNQAARILFDYSDFTSFSKLHTGVKTNNCRIMHAEWTMQNDCMVFTIQADRFLRNMVRSIVGTLLEVGKGKLSLDGFRSIIESKNRCNAGTSVPAQALFLTGIDYPE